MQPNLYEQLRALVEAKLAGLVQVIDHHDADLDATSDASDWRRTMRAKLRLVAKVEALTDLLVDAAAGDPDCLCNAMAIREAWNARALEIKASTVAHVPPTAAQVLN